MGGEHGDELVGGPLGESFEDDICWGDGVERLGTGTEDADLGDALDLVTALESHALDAGGEDLAWLGFPPSETAGDGFCPCADLRGGEGEGDAGIS